MRWSPQQDAVLRDVSTWLNSEERQVYRLFGYAGTGKTTLARHLAEGVEGGVLFGAYTGKAAHVLRQKGCPDASTIHSLIYHPKEHSRAMLLELEAALAEAIHELRSELHPDDRPDANFDADSTIVELRRKIEVERKNISRPMFSLNSESEVALVKLVIIDECSMVDEQMGEDLLSFGTKILVLGDPAQLPPVRGEGFFIGGSKPDTLLTDIHRQARDNPIIAMADLVRQEQSLKLGSYGESQVVEKSSGAVGEQEAMAASQVLVGRNKTRHSSNRRMRELTNRQGDYPVPGDKLVCLRNNHDIGLLNGAIWYVEDVGEIDDDRVVMTIAPEDGGNSQTVDAHAHHFLGREETLAWWERKEAEEFDYGYALTVHKAQGSQWDDVLLYDESWCFRKDRWRWLYTGLTRAAEKITVVRM